MSKPAPTPIPIAAARTLFLQGAGLLTDPARPATTATTLKLIQSLGFVQLDSINIVERAHHHILWTRLHRYQPTLLHRLQRSGRIFENWTHDASLIPSSWFPHWRHRFERAAWGAWLKSRMGADCQPILDEVLNRIRSEGPLMARDYEHRETRSGPWWDWKPAKAALEYLWRTGSLAIPERRRFEKVYDLTERVLPKVHSLPAPTAEDHTEWACSTALDRLGTATPRQIAAFWAAIPIATAAGWCASAAAAGRIVAARLPGASDRTIHYTWPDWQRRAAAAPPPPDTLRILSPFDPLIRDRARCLHLFGFDYRFEAFTPESKRTYGYYILPILDRDRLIGRLDPKLDRDAGLLRIRKLWWEPGIRPAKALHKRLEAALDRYAAFTGAADWELQHTV